MAVEGANGENSYKDVKNCEFLDAGNVGALLTFSSLISHLETSLPDTVSIQAPIRQNFAINPNSSLLLMPSWSTLPSLPFIGVKIATAFPQNSACNLPGIHASYLLFSSSTGQVLAVMDGTELTLWRTASVSALAAKYLVRQDAEVLVMIGAGSLAPYLIRAHLEVRPTLKKVIIWNRTAKKAQDLVKFMEEQKLDISFEFRDSLDEVVSMADIVSCATSSESPLVKGKLLKPGAHLDLVGSFTHSMRECDDEAIGRGRVYIDNEAAFVEAGELVGAFHRGVISRGDICGSLLELVKGEKGGRTAADEVTVFKSVGSAVADILTAQLVYRTSQVDIPEGSVSAGTDSST